MNSIESYVNQPGRLLDFEGAYNVRDLGGYPAAGGRKVKWGRLFRSGDLNNLSDTDLEKMAKIPLKTFIDFRDDSEVRESPDRLPSSVERAVRLPIVIGSMKEVIESGQEPDGLVMMPWINEKLATDFHETFARFLAMAAEEDNAPLLFHCTAGKDRTGFAAMLLLTALGVGMDLIMADYLLSTECLREKYAPLVERHPYMAPLVRVEPEYLEAALKVINEQYKGLDNYLANVLKADVKRLRELYTE
ncbi:protein-tyrosine-phosphatase [Deltaproteobacteria bacterium Smac51]|nr:protein-tyrosine-phosphatase [Deltaproteobacteria bacterium Smac51]